MSSTPVTNSYPQKKTLANQVDADMMRLETHATQEYSASSDEYSDQYSWNSAEKEDEVFEDEMNIDLTEYNIDETGLDYRSMESEDQESNGRAAKTV